ncbi:MAG: terminase family protein [Hyphomonadaceae bacterium]|nr:terminase family protein [Hyphomonadaceae bacterium]
MRTFFRSVPKRLAERLRHDFQFWAHPAQLPPEGRWRTWVFLGGRGAGKTRAGAEWVKRLARREGRRRIALIAPTLHDVREVMIEGASGILKGADAPMRYEPSRRRLVWSNGAQAFGFSAEDPESLRGPQFDAAWADELCYWAHPDATLDTLAHALRLGDDPQLLVTTTPRPTPALKKLLASDGVAVTRATTWDNAENLAPGFIEALRAGFSESVRQRQELLGELIEDPEGALWTRAQIEACRAPAPETFDEIVVAIDPPVSVGPDADACGIVAVGRAGEVVFVLADATVQGKAPAQWAACAGTLARSVGAHAIIAETNNGGELVRTVLRIAAQNTPVLSVQARDSKFARALPVSALYAQGRVRHAGAFAALEDEMCAFGARASGKSPDRVDALVWAVTHLLITRARPRIGVL